MQTYNDESSTAHVDQTRTLAADEVRLSGGRIARVRRTNALHDHRSDMLVVAAGFDKGGVPGTEPRTVLEAVPIADIPYLRDWRATHHAHERDDQR